ncbi:MAG: 4-(cytidine 5'-diphospho)-2-C-methyl-D-erythritol kinase [Flavobacteriia bacterium]|nr:4-(cytidine 5'-diphospho)-2-C-methyl-D-erythritol kinase [Flavobacteriia bacterium]
MILFPPAKINLGLNVLFKREDGFHEIETGMIQIPFFDVLEVLSAVDFEFKQSGIVIDGDVEANLCVKAFRLIKKNHAIGNVYIHLNKIIPMGAGLGGGSSDAANVILALNELFDLKLTIEKMQIYAAELGSDCPFFISKNIQIGKGRGELLTTIDVNFKGYYLKIVNIGLHVSTKEAYSNISLSTENHSISELLKGEMLNWKRSLKNDFEASVFKIFPELLNIKEQFYKQGAIYAAMSGSGSTMFGIFATRPILNFEDREDILEIILEF